ncbi:MAG TPA: GNAT family N-acetyltransferase [Patescibacteria group bacterium]|jgi:RimJ/RimL family protein N-acetyltransferase|nr:GNAT family N-acetyltransferase [Patescibacteria group bacterium]
MASVAQIETERLLLRERRDGDVAAWAKFTSDPDFRRYIPVRRSDETPEQRAERGISSLMARWEKEPLKGVGWVIARRDDDQVIGQGGFEEGEVPEDGEIDYRFGKPFWGQGYGREAAHAMSRFVIDNKLFERLVAYIVPGNVGSIRIAEGLGMRYERDVDYLQFFPDPSRVELADPMTRMYAARPEDMTVGDGHYRVINGGTP